MCPLVQGPAGLPVEKHCGSGLGPGAGGFTDPGQDAAELDHLAPDLGIGTGCGSRAEWYFSPQAVLARHWKKPTASASRAT